MDLELLPRSSRDVNWRLVTEGHTADAQCGELLRRSAHGLDDSRLPLPSCHVLYRREEVDDRNGPPHNDRSGDHLGLADTGNRARDVGKWRLMRNRGLMATARVRLRWCHCALLNGNAVQSDGGVGASGNYTNADSTAGDSVAIDAATGAVPDEIAEIAVVQEGIVADGAARRRLHQQDADIIVRQLVVRDYRARSAHAN